jgi:starvation-inducible DNA-binding protein
MDIDYATGGPSNQDLAQALASLLGDTVTIKFLAHGYHWNVRGPQFTQFHKFFLKLYEDFDSAIDPTAENLRKLNFDAPFLLEDYAALTCIQPRAVSSDPLDMASALYDANNLVLNSLNNVYSLANALNQQGVCNFIAGRIDQHMFWAWWLRTTIGADATTPTDLGKTEADLPLGAPDDMDETDVVIMLPNGDSNSPIALPAPSAVGQPVAAAARNSEKRKVVFSDGAEAAIQRKVKLHNTVSGAKHEMSLAVARAVYRRGVQAFALSGNPDTERHDWAMTRLNAFSHLLKNEVPSNAKYDQDNDLLPPSHPKSNVSKDSALTAAVSASRELTVELKDESAYNSPEEAIYSLAEFSGLGYEIVPALRAAWKRGVRDNVSAFKRAADLAIETYESIDSDLLPNAK